MSLKKISIRNLTVFFLALGLMINTINVSAYSGLSQRQQETADKIAEITMDNYDKYHVLPSVAVGQAFTESSLGVHNPNYNMWGISSGRTYYGSFKEGVLGYLGVINNGYYPGATDQKDYHKQLRKILDGGYCQPEGSYYPDTIGAIEYYGWDKYDKELKKRIKQAEKEKEIAKRKETKHYSRRA